MSARYCKWFESVFGFPEKDFESTRGCFSVEESSNGEIILETRHPQLPQQRHFHVGRFETPSLSELRARLELQSEQSCESLPAASSATPLRFRHISGDVGDLHRDRKNQGAVFQAASQFNCLEMVSPRVRPEDGITRYALDRTQGPVCALACPAGTLYRNYFWNGTGQGGQGHQMNLLQDLGTSLHNTNETTHESVYWSMHNGYALSAAKNSIRELRLNVLEKLEDRERALETLRVGIHWDTQVGAVDTDHRVAQVYCSALSISYDTFSSSIDDWDPFARLVLDAAYESTFAAAVLLSRQRRRQGMTNRVQLFLTKLGGGVFGNRDEWISNAIVRSLVKFRAEPLDVSLVHYGSIDQYYMNRILRIT